VVSELQEAYDNVEPKLCAFLGPFDCWTAGVQETPSRAISDLRIFPNPAEHGTTFTFALPKSAAVCIEVYDVTGRLQRKLVDQSYGPGKHTLSWDGLDDHGRPATSGIYSVRFDADGLEQTGKLLVTR